MTNIDQAKWDHAKKRVLERVTEAFDLLATAAEAGQAWQVHFSGKVSLGDAKIDASIPIGYRTDVFADDRLPDEDAEGSDDSQ